MFIPNEIGRIYHVKYIIIVVRIYNIYIAILNPIIYIYFFFFNAYLYCDDDLTDIFKNSFIVTY